jgi:protoheme IX farnesyltransferase
MGPRTTMFQLIPPRISPRFTFATASVSAKSRLCYRCLNILVGQRYFSSTFFAPNGIVLHAPTVDGRIGGISWRARKSHHYFLSNSVFFKRERSSIIDAVRPTTTQKTVGNSSENSSGRVQLSDKTKIDDLPHRRRRQISTAADGVILPDASSLLSTSSASSDSAVKRDAFAYLLLSKPRLTALIVLTTMASYALFPVDPLLSSTPTLSTLTLIYLTLGTTLCSSSANALNMAAEPKFDSQMSRTRNRPLVRGLLSIRQATTFAGVTGALGITALLLGVNPTVAALGALNIFLYAGVYTPLKRISVANTWVGAVVGGIPPLMGWAAAAGASAVDGTAAELLSHPGGWLLAALLFAWQFPHFNALSWTIRNEYRSAGYVMMAWKYPRLNARVALRYSILFLPICVGLYTYGVVDAGFLFDSTIVNAWLIREAYKFYRFGGEKGRARGLFWASVWHLPLLLGLAMAHKSGLWSGVLERLIPVDPSFGDGEDLGMGYPGDEDYDGEIESESGIDDEGE